MALESLTIGTKVDLAVNIASNKMDERYLSKGIKWHERIDTKAGAVYRVKPELEQEFDNLYDEAFEMINGATSYSTVTSG